MAHSREEAGQAVAVVGIGCRMPGGINGPRSLWEQVAKGLDAVGPIPRDRWDSERYYSPDWQRPGRMNSRQGGFLDRVDGFDAAFFGIPRRVAEQMDPQQRLLLEICWEALEDAGIAPTDLAGSRAGVFVGGCSQDYGGLQTSLGELEGLGGHSATGAYLSILSNRLSYTLDLHGPSMTIDTACSSSLVAAHLACESLRRGESDLALVGGVNLMLHPGGMVALSQASMFSPDGRSRAFDATATGYVRGEGAGLVVLKPLDRARRDKDRIYAVISGTAVNQDGRTQGITVPSGDAQEANFRAALAVAGIEPREVGYVEAHGTGTPVGDPIEANALGRVLAADRDPEQVAFVGSVKTNIGHLEGGAGIAGLIKAALSVHHRRILPNRHFEFPNPEIDFARWRLAVPTAEQDWPAYYDRAIASVNSFGFGGTNANVVLEQAPDHEATRTHSPPDTPVVLTLSARSEPALRQLAGRYAEHLAEHPAELETVAANLALRRSHHAERLAVTAAGAEEAVARLRGYAEGVAERGVVANSAHQGRGKLAFVFNGQGPQWFAMGRTLLRSSPVFAAKVAECDQLAREYVDWSILDALNADEESSPVQATYCLQPTMFAIQVALVELWRSWGIEPDGVAGHSMGEIAAAHVSGALDLATALRVICRRARIQEDADPTGAMMFVALPKDEALALCDRYADGLWLAAENSPSASTLSGRRDILEPLARELTEDGVFARLLKVNCACHSKDMDPLEQRLRQQLAGVEGRETVLPMYSTATGGLIEGGELDTGYWWRNFRQPVLFAPAVRAMLADGFDTFVELSPHPVLGNSVTEIAREAGVDVLSVGSLVRGKDDWTCFLDAFGTLYTAGADVRWERRHPHPVPALDLPVNPWIHESFWNESEVSRRSRTQNQPHPMLRSVDATRPTWEIDWEDHRYAWVKQHDVFGSVIVPGAVYVETALAAAREVTGERCALEYVEFERACVLAPDESQRSRIELDPDDGTFTIHSRSVRGSTWIRNAYGRYHRAPGDPTAQASAFDLEAIRTRCGAPRGAGEVYGPLRDRGYVYGPALCGIDQLRVGQGETLARIEVPRVLTRGQGLAGYQFHPALLDACFQSLLVPPADEPPDAVRPANPVPTGVERVRVYGDIPARLWCHTRLTSVQADTLVTDVFVLDDNGRLLAEYIGLRAKSVRRPTDTATQDSIENQFHRLVWQRDPDAHSPGQPRPSALTEGPADVLPGLEALGEELGRRLQRQAYATDYQTRVRELCAAYVVHCLSAFGFGTRVGEAFAVPDCTGLLAEHRRVFGVFLQFLVEDGVLSEQDGGYRFERLPDADPGRLWAALLADHPSCVWELRLLRSTGERLHEVLVGDVNPLELLFPAGSTEIAALVYDSSPAARLYNTLAREAIRRLVDGADPRRTLRVLEVGGGTGGLTAAVLPVLPANRCEYVFTDVSPAFTQAARDRFRDFGFVEYRTLDIEDDPRAQGLDPGSFDLVLASDVVHATADLKLTLLHLQDLLAPGGVLALIEAAPGSRWLELTFGLTAGWWLFRDLRLRPDGPLLPAPDWEGVLDSTGYEDIVALGDPGHQGAGSQTVLLARAARIPSDAPGQGADSGSPEPPGSWVIVGESAGVGAELARRIQEHGGRAVHVPPGRAEDLGRLFASLHPRGIVHLWDGAEEDSADDPAQALERAAREHALRVADMVRALDGAAPSAWPRLYLVTRGAHAQRNPATRLDGAAAWGLGLVVGLEQPSLGCTLIDLEGEPTEGEADALWTELRRGDHEREVLLRAGERFVRRLVALPPDQVRAPVDAHRLPAGAGFELGVTMPGALDDLEYRQTALLAPGPGQVELEVVAAGLNFLDVMTALGQVPPLEDADGYRFGAECSGVVTRIGAGVAGLQPGDAVVAMSCTGGAIGSHLTVDQAFVVAKPEALSFEEAATVPVVFLTASYALRKLARLRPGERILIHSAAGGTGLAALQIAHLLGAEVLATAGSPDKRELLRRLGVRHVMDSRSLTFADEVLAATDGQGVDVVLSAATGETTTRSIGCLAAYGRYIDIGKRDLMGDRRIGLRPFLQNLAYFSFDLRQLMVDRPHLVHEELADLLQFFASGALRPLPYLAHHPTQVEAAMRRLTSGGHVGKVVLAMDERDVRVVPAVRHSLAMPSGTWLVTGGLGGLGLAMAERLADAGARHLVLVGRSGIPDEPAGAKVEALRARGVTVLAEAVDVTSRDQVAALLTTIERELPPLRGVLHSAMVLEDALLTDLDDAGLRKVLGPKVLGALHLHELTAHLPLDVFALFSSATSMVGNMGQAAYAAANAVLDQLAEQRHAAGQPALSVNWGALSDVGYVSRNERVHRQVATTGLRGLSAAQAFQALSTLADGSCPRVGVLPVDWPKFFRHRDTDADTEPRYEQQYALHVAGAQAAAGAAGESLRTRLRSCTGDERRDTLVGHLKARLVTALGIPVDRLDDSMPLTNYIDSLLAVEISVWIEREVGVKASVMDLMRGKSVADLAADLLARLDDEEVTEVVS
ncbi:SDR family NAD(P)-dependent oxidoreductase [Streptomyces sp. NBC_00005]|uniref:SDR family NAD(P)-dependent oxidoreductase n=1 Tax=Streptomyces sp. NBC_00005 TaxID=2903609 RepID=UPI00324937A7